MRDYAFLHSLYDSIHFSGHRQVNLFAQRITAESPPIENSRNQRTSFLARLSRVEQNQKIGRSLLKLVELSLHMNTRASLFATIREDHPSNTSLKRPAGYNTIPKLKIVK
jgi:hypothetical protein